MTTRNPFEDLEQRIEARRAEVEDSPGTALAGLAARVKERRSSDVPSAKEQLDELGSRVEARRSETGL